MINPAKLFKHGFKILLLLALACVSCLDFESNDFSTNHNPHNVSRAFEPVVEGLLGPYIESHSALISPYPTDISGVSSEIE